MSKRTTVELLDKYRRELNLEKKSGKKRKKSTIYQIDIKKISKRKKKKFKKKLNPAIQSYLADKTKEEMDAFWYHYDTNQNLIDFDMIDERNRRIRENRKRNDKFIDDKLREMDVFDLDDLMEVDKIIEKSSKNYYKRFKKFGYEIGEDDIIYVNEDKLIHRLKQERKNFKKVNAQFLEYLEKTMGSDSVYANNLEKAERKLSKNTSDLIKSFEAVAIESSIFKLR